MLNLLGNVTDVFERKNVFLQFEFGKSKLTKWKPKMQIWAGFIDQQCENSIL